MRELQEKELKQVSGGASANWYTTTSPPTAQGGGVGIVTETYNKGGHLKIPDDTPPPG